MSAQKTSINPFVFIILALVVVGASWWGITALSEAKTAGAGEAQAGPGGPPPASVILAPVESRSSVQTQRVVGTLRAKNRSEIAARESGPILEIMVDEGDLVEANQVLATLDPRRLEAQISEAKAEIIVAEALVHQKKSRVKRTTLDLEMKEKLFANKALSESEVLDARSAANVDNSVYAATEESLKAAQSRLELFQVRQADLEIRAPYPGRVVARHAELGEWVEPGASIVTLVSSGDIEAWLKVPERFATAAQGKEIPVTLTATGKTVTSTALTLVPEADTSSRSLQMVALLPNADNALIPGLSVTAEIPVTEKTERLAVPVNALVQGYAGPGVFVPATNPDSPMPVARRVPVEVVYQDEAFVYLAPGELTAEDQVVVEGNERLFPFQPLIIGEREKTPEIAAQP